MSDERIWTFSSMYESPQMTRWERKKRDRRGEDIALLLMLRLAAINLIALQRRLSLFVVSHNRLSFKMLKQHFNAVMESRFYLAIFVLHMLLFIFHKTLQNFRAPLSAHHDAALWALPLTPRLTWIASESCNNRVKRKKLTITFITKFVVNNFSRHCEKMYLLLQQ